MDGRRTPLRPRSPARRPKSRFEGRENNCETDREKAIFLSLVILARYFHWVVQPVI